MASGPSATCARIAPLLSAFAGDDLDAGAAEAVRVHLLDCHRCRRDAAGFRRALATLQRCREQPPPGVDDAFFASMHATIAARCAGEEVTAGPRVGWWRWPLAAAAAAALIAAGFWWGHDPSVSLWDRAPVGTAATFEEPKAVPWSGPRVPLRLLGNDGGVAPEPVDDGARDPGSGLRARDRLRSLVDDGMLLPPRQRGR
jgi:hypothetical protein